MQLLRLHASSCNFFADSGTTADVIVLGAGVGGLVAAANLAKANLNVKILEKQVRVGGRMQTDVYASKAGDSYRFDVGPSLLLLPDIYKKTFAELGHDLETYVTLLKVAPLYRCFFDDGTHMDISSDKELMKRYSLYDSLQMIIV